MPRRGNVPKREILPDPVYNSVLVSKLINSVMLDGKKGIFSFKTNAGAIIGESPKAVLETRQFPSAHKILPTIQEISPILVIFLVIRFFPLL